MAPNLDRVLGLSSKRSVSGHKLKSDMAAIEFDGVHRPIHMNEGWIQPSEMYWSIEHFIARQDQYEKLVEDKFFAKRDKLIADQTKVMEKEQAKADEEDKLDESLRALAEQADNEETDITSGQANKIF